MMRTCCVRQELFDNGYAEYKMKDMHGATIVIDL